MAGRYNRWLRQKLADRIRANGGYRRYNTCTFPLSWEVRYFQQLGDAEKAAELIAGEHYLSMADFILQHPDFEEWFEGQDTDKMWEHAQTCLVDAHSDDGEISCCSSSNRSRKACV